MIEVPQSSTGAFSRIPKAVPFILISILIERYSSGGIAGEIILRLMENIFIS